MHSLPLFFAGAFGLGGPEVMVIFAVLLLLFGGSKLPDLAKGLGKSIKEFKRATREDSEPAPAELTSQHSTAAVETGKSAVAPTTHS